MRIRWLIPIAMLFPLRLIAADNAVKPRVATITINPSGGDDAITCGRSSSR
jgi:hypothetical protein